MAHAKFTTQDGISIDLEGTPEELSAVVEKLRQDRAPGNSSQGKPGRNKPGRTKLELPQLIEALRNEDFFRQPKGLGATREKLAEMGHHYPLTTLSGAMQTEARTRRLRRFKQDGRYVYVQ
jgi:superfamily II DNA/RNA helicase